MNTPALSVIVPTCNRLHLLKQTLESLFHQEAREFRTIEVVVVDDGSVDGTEEYLRSLSKVGKIRFVRQPNRGPSAARNAGAAEATASLIAFTDDDCVLPADWMLRIVTAFEQSPYALVGGTVRNARSGNFFSALSQEITTYFVQHQSTLHDGPMFLTSNNLAVRADAFRSVGGFDERFRHAGGEERALVLRIARSGGKTVLLDDLMVDHYHELSVARYLKQQLNYGRGAFLLHRVVAREERCEAPHVPISSHRGLIGAFFESGILSGMWKTGWYAIGQSAVLIGYILQSAQPRIHLKQQAT